jgi:dihydrofolate reductase
MKISIIAAIGRNRELGKGGKIPWHISEDFKRFKQITLGHPVIMGRKTWESLPLKPLPGRYSIVITRDSKYTIQNTKNVAITRSLEKALRLASLAQGNDECFIIGGGQIFNQSISLADKLYLTIIDASFDADTFFPDYSDFKKISEEDGQEGNYKYKFIELEK